MYSGRAVRHGAAPGSEVAPRGPAHTSAHPWESREAIARIAAVLPPLERAYARARFGIFRTKFLALLNLTLPEEGRLLDVGCGFGLFSLYFALTAEGRMVHGIDPDARRVAVAQRAAAALGVADRVHYQVGRAETLPLGDPYDAIYMLDVLHHLPREQQVPLLHRLRRLVAPQGILLVKEVTTDDPFKLRFTELLDRVMVGWDEPLSYRHHAEWATLLARLGFGVRSVRVPDILPYPHVVMVARRPGGAVVSGVSVP
jgi:2-polyprenyl-3-methyl-5-hydroxy-6-metoxy-1,4-benzoquinol methylase